MGKVCVECVEEETETHSVRRQFLQSLFVTFVAALLSVSAHATPITYKVHRVIGHGSVTGFIQTDGTIGVLSSDNFLDWSLLLKVGTSTFELRGPLSGNNSSIFVRGFDAEAFDSFLLFNFSGIDYGVLMFEKGLFSGHHYYCDSTQPFECGPGETVVPVNKSNGYQNAEHHGVVVIGTADDPAPEPATCSLIVSGLAVLVLKQKSLLGLASLRD